MNLRNRPKFLPLFFLPLFAFPLTSRAQDPQVAEVGSEASVRVLALRDAIDQALEDNLGLRIQRLDPEIAAEQVTVEESAFDVELFAEGSLRQVEREETFTATEGTESDLRRYAAGARKRFSLGTTLTAETSLNRTYSNALIDTVVDDDPISSARLSHESDLLLSVRQPLLRGFGTEFNLARVARAQKLAEIERLLLRNTVQEVIRETEFAYWEVAWAYSNRRLLESSLRVAESLLEEARERERIGVATRVDVLQARAALAQRQEAVILAQQAVDDAEDRILSLLGALAYDAPIESDLAVASFPDDFPQAPEFPDLWRRALANDVDLSILEARLEQRDLELVLADDATRPELDVTVFGGYIGTDRESGQTAFDNALDRQGEQWGVAMEFSMPWGFSGARASRRQVEKQMEQEELRIIQAKQSLYELARNAWRSFASSLKRRDAAQLTLELQEEAFAQERVKYETGVATFRDVLEAQRDLDDARLSLLNAARDLIRAEVQLQYVDGTLLERHGFTWEEVEK